MAPKEGQPRPQFLRGLKLFVRMDPKLGDEPDMIDATTAVGNLIVNYGGTLVPAIAEADLCLLQHRKQPEHEEATHLLKRCVNLVWLLAGIARGRAPPYAEVAASDAGGGGGSASSLGRRYRPFPMSAVTTQASHGACVSGFVSDERAIMQLLLRCTGARVTKNLRLMHNTYSIVVAPDANDEQSPKIAGARRRPSQAGVANSLWVLDCLVEGRFLPLENYPGVGSIVELLRQEAGQAPLAGGGQEGSLVVLDSEDAAVAGPGCAAVGGSGGIRPSCPPPKAAAALRSAVQSLHVSDTGSGGRAARHGLGGSVEQLPPAADEAGGEREQALAATELQSEAAPAQQHPQPNDVRPQAGVPAQAPHSAPQLPSGSLGSGAPLSQRARFAGATQAMHALGGFIDDLGTEAPVFAADDSSGRGPEAAAPSDAPVDGVEEAAPLLPAAPPSPAGSQQGEGDETPSPRELGSPPPGGGGLAVLEHVPPPPPAGVAAPGVAFAVRPQEPVDGGVSRAAQAADEAVLAAAAAAAEEAAAAAAVGLEDKGSETDADDSPLRARQVLHAADDHQAAPLASAAADHAAAEGMAAASAAGDVGADAEDVPATQPVEEPAEQAGAAAASAAEAPGPASEQLPGVAALSADEEEPGYAGQEAGSDSQGEEEDAGFADAAEELAFEVSPAAGTQQGQEGAVSPAPGLAAAEAAPAAAAPAPQAAAGTSLAVERGDTSPVLSAAKQGVTFAAAPAMPLGRTTRSRSKSATPAGEGGGGKKKRKSAPARAVIWSQAPPPEGDAKEMRSLARMAKKDVAASAAAAAEAAAHAAAEAATAAEAAGAASPEATAAGPSQAAPLLSAAASARKAALARTSQAGLNNDGLETAPPLRRRGGRTPAAAAAAQHPAAQSPAPAGGQAGTIAPQQEEQAGLQQQKVQAAPAPRGRGRPPTKRKASEAAASNEAAEQPAADGGAAAEDPVAATAAALAGKRSEPASRPFRRPRAAADASAVQWSPPPARHSRPRAAAMAASPAGTAADPPAPDRSGRPASGRGQAVQELEKEAGAAMGRKAAAAASGGAGGKAVQGRKRKAVPRGPEEQGEAEDGAGPQAGAGSTKRRHASAAAGKAPAAKASPAAAAVKPAAKPARKPSAAAAAAAAEAPAARRGSAARRRTGTPAAAAAAVGASSVASPCVALSGMHSDEQAELAAKLRRLKVRVITGNQRHNWSPEVTHVVSAAPRRNQKCLAAMAAGGWLVGPEWVEACEAAGRLVAEEEFELLQAGPDLAAGAARHWRARHAASGQRAFEGLRVAVAAQLGEPFKREDITNVVKAGGGRLVQLSAAVDLAIAAAPAKGATPDEALAGAARRGALVAAPLFAVEWVAKPQAKLAQHALLRSKPGAALAAAMAARGTKQAAALVAGETGDGSGDERAGSGNDGNASDVSILFD